MDLLIRLDLLADRVAHDVAGDVQERIVVIQDDAHGRPAGLVVMQHPGLLLGIIG